MDIFEALFEKTGAAHAVGFSVGVFANVLFLARRFMRFKFSDVIVMIYLKIAPETLSIAKWLGTEKDEEAMDLLQEKITSIYMAGYCYCMSEQTIHNLAVNASQIIRQWLLASEDY